MKTLLERLHIKKSQQRPRPEEEWRDLIARLVPQKSFIDVGCMWNVHGACLHAAAHGTAPVVGLDVTEGIRHVTENAGAEDHLERLAQEVIEVQEFFTYRRVVTAACTLGEIANVPWGRRGAQSGRRSDPTS